MRAKRSVVLGVSVLLSGFVAASGCGTSSTPSGSSDASAPSGPSAAREVVGAAGGTVTTPDGATIEIPPGALASETTITITPEAQPGLPAEASAAGTAYLFGPEGLTFEKPVTVSLPFDPAKLPAGATVADLVVLTAPGGTTNFSALMPSTANGAKVFAATTHLSIFVPGVVACAATCGGSGDGTASTCSCSATCLGVDYAMSCTNGACTCSGGGSGSTNCTDSAAVSATFRNACGFPGSPETDDKDAGADAASDCAVACGGASNETCSCSSTCKGSTYEMSCTGGSCTCVKNGQTTTTGSGPSCETPSTLCAEFGALCGFTAACSSTSDAGTDPLPTDGGTCDMTSCSGGANSCSCTRQCGATTYAMSCSGTACSCTAGGTETMTFTGSGSCNDFATCGYP